MRAQSLLLKLTSISKIFVSVFAPLANILFNESPPGVQQDPFMTILTGVEILLALYTICQGMM